MSDREAADGPAQSERRPRWMRWLLALGIATTVLGAIGLVVTEPAVARDLQQPRHWAIGVLFAGLYATAVTLAARRSPHPAQPSSAPRRPSRLLLVIAGMALLMLPLRPQSLRPDALDSVYVLLPAYLLAVYGYQWWRYRRSPQARAPRDPHT